MGNFDNLNRRDFIKGAALGGFTAAMSAGSIPPNPERDAMNDKATSPVRLEAKRWSELPAVLENYEKMLNAGDGNSRIFGYASLIKNHANEKPAASAQLENEKARLNGMEVAMNVLAAGEIEFRGTRGTYIDEQGKTKKFANVGVYAGLEPALNAGGYAEGLNITARPEDRQASLKAYIQRELGTPPEGITLEDIFDKNALQKFEQLKKNPEADSFGMYKFQVVDVDTEKGKKPAVTVSTNEESKFAAIGNTPMQTAQLILDGQGYNRKNGDSRVGGSALDYFKGSVIGVARELKLNQPRLEAIDAAVEELAHVYAEADKIVSQKLPMIEEQEKLTQLIKAHPDIESRDKIPGIRSPRFNTGENVNKRPPVSDEDKALPTNRMPHTAEEKFRRIASLQTDGKTQRSR